MPNPVTLADVAPKAKVGPTGVVTLEHNQSIGDALTVRCRAFNVFASIGAARALRLEMVEPHIGIRATELNARGRQCRSDTCVLQPQACLVIVIIPGVWKTLGRTQ
jgi:hypothetical protein